MRLSYQLQLGQFESAKETDSALLEPGSKEEYRAHGALIVALLKCDRETCREVEKMMGAGTLATVVGRGTNNSLNSHAAGTIATNGEEDDRSSSVI